MTTMASTSQTNPAYDVPLFNACDHLIALHQEKKGFGIHKKQPDHQTDQYFIHQLPLDTLEGARFGLKNITTVG